MSFAWVIAAAMAAEPVIDVHGAALVEDRFGGGVGGSIGAAWPQAELGLGLDALFTSDDQGPVARGFLRPRLHLFPSAGEGSRGHLVLGGGLWSANPDLEPVAEIGAGLDLSGGSIRPRVVASYVVGPSGDGRALLSFGIVRHPRPEPEAPAPIAVIPSFDAAMVWVPDPVCEWLPPDDAADQWAGTGSPADPSEATTVARPERVATEATETAAELGDLVVAAYVGDDVFVDGEPLTVDADGIAWTQRTPGRAEISVRGGGRATQTTVALAAEGTLWYAAPAPADAVRVTFTAGSASLDPSGTAAVQAIAKELAGWHIEVWGSFSPEGNVETNRRLATQRAEAVAEVLAAFPVPRARITVLPPRAPEAGLPPDQQRAAVLHVVEPR